MKVTALLPMKRHSERVPGKNMRVFLGRPLYHLILETLLSCPSVASVVVNTDSSEIADDARSSFPGKVVIHERPDDICGDDVSMNRIIENDLGRLEGEQFLQTHSTNPLLRLATVEQALTAYEEGLKRGRDSLFAVTTVRKRLYDSSGAPINHDPASLRRTQDLQPVYVENSCLYVFSRQSFAPGANRIGAQPTMFEVAEEEAWDIDTEEDFRVAEILYAGRVGSRD